MRCSSLDTAALVVAVGATLAGCASRGPRAAEMEHMRERRACQVRPEACGPEAGLEAWAAGLRRLRAEQCGTDHGLGPGAAEFVCEEPAWFVRYDFDLMPWMNTDWGLGPAPGAAVRSCAGKAAASRPWTAASGSSGCRRSTTGRIATG